MNAIINVLFKKKRKGNCPEHKGQAMKNWSGSFVKYKANSKHKSDYELL